MKFRQPFRNEWPITQKYGETITSTFHTGIDYGCPMNTPILASADGLVMFAGEDKTGYGNVVIIRHSTGIATLYAHLSAIYVSVNQYLKQGNEIGLSGNTGYSTGPHLHFEARTLWNDFRTHFDPMELPLTTVDDSIHEKTKPLSCPDEGIVQITAPAGAFAHDREFLFKAPFACGSEFVFTGETVERNGLTFCKCSVWIAANDGETQILSSVS